MWVLRSPVEKFQHHNEANISEDRLNKEGKNSHRSLNVAWLHAKRDPTGPHFLSRGKEEKNEGLRFTAFPPTWNTEGISTVEESGDS